jgi:hypothetical protein
MKPTVQVITAAERGAYNFKRSATLLYTSTSGTAYLIADLWRGGNVEGECYRTHICKLDAEDHKTVVNRTQFQNGEKFVLDSVEFGDLMDTMPLTWVRYRHANPTHKRILDKAQKLLCAV